MGDWPFYYSMRALFLTTVARNDNLQCRYDPVFDKRCAKITTGKEKFYWSKETKNYKVCCMCCYLLYCLLAPRNQAHQYFCAPFTAPKPGHC